MPRWLMKTEPSAFGIEHLAAAPNGVERWDGVRNNQARNIIRDHMRPGQEAFLYHSSVRPPGVVGVMEIVSEPYPDPTAVDLCDVGVDPRSDPGGPRWFCVDVRLRERLPRLVSLQEIREEPVMEGSPLIRRGSRLSIVPVTEAQWHAIRRLAGLA